MLIFKASALGADAFYKWKCPFVCLFVCFSVCSLFRYHLNVFLPQLPKVGCPQFLEIRNPWGKVMDRSGLRFETFINKGVKSTRKKYCFWANFDLLSRIFLDLVFLTTFNGLFAPTSQSPMCKKFKTFRILVAK